MIEVLTQVGVDQERIRLLPNFLVSPLQPPKKVAFADPVRIATMGRFVERKGFSTLLLAVRELRNRGVDARVVIAGDGPDRQNLQNESRTLDIVDAVKFPGWLDDRQKLEMLSNADIFVCPSLHEPFGLVLIEAAQAGLPIITTDTTGAKYIFRDRTDALFAPVGDAAAMADRIEAVIRDPALAQALADQASATFRERFHVSGAAPKFVSLLTDMMEHWREGRPKVRSKRALESEPGT
jgi:glycosyltransferase involved in cell wall biosynthesis